MSNWLRCVASVGFSFLLMSGGAAAETNLPAPTQEILLSVSTPNASPETVDLDFAGLESLPARVLRTTTPWTDGEQVFEGFLLRDLVAAVGAEGETLKAVALNDYIVDIPMTDVRDFDVIAAYRRNGERMSVRDKGPLWIIYPDDQAGPMAQSRMVWQLRRLEIVQ
jgi:hypothetical protein